MRETSSTACRLTAERPLASPAVRFADDPEDALAGYRELGFHVEPDVWTPEQIAALNAAADRVSAARGGSVAPMMNPHREEPLFLTALRNRRLVAILERLVGGRVNGLQTQYFFCAPGTPGFSRHQDNFYVQAKREGFASAWSALEDVDAENGGLVLYPRTHLEPILAVEVVADQRLSETQDPNANYREAVVPAHYAPFTPVLPAGSVAFFHGHLVHSSNDNATTDRWRRSLLMTYIREGEPFRAGHSKARSVIAAYETGGDEEPLGMTVERRGPR
jgi:ectoine hydroxylase-related dioxygenase (phytanoyl-CoA dioxygenase family)